MTLEKGAVRSAPKKFVLVEVWVSDPKRTPSRTRALIRVLDGALGRAVQPGSRVARISVSREVDGLFEPHRLALPMGARVGVRAERGASQIEVALEVSPVHALQLET